MATYRYRRRIIDETKLRKEIVDGYSVNIADVSPRMYIDITASAAAKSDLDDAMDFRGFEFIEEVAPESMSIEDAAFTEIANGTLDAYVSTVVLDGYIKAEDHKTLDQLVHNVAEDSFDEFIYTNFHRVSSIITWENQTKIKKIKERQISYAGIKVSEIITIQYDPEGAETERLTETFNYKGFNIDNVVRTLTP